MLDIDYIVKKHRLNSLEKDILTSIQEKILKQEKISIREVAKINYTSTSVIYNCIKKIGFNSFTDLIFYIKNSKTEVDIDDNLTLPIKILTSNPDSLIMFLSVGIANNITSYMNERITLIGRRSIANTHLQLLNKNLTNDTVLIVVSESGETDSLLDMIKEANSNNIPIISFVGKNNSSIAKLSTFSFEIEKGIFFAEVINSFEKLLSKI
ncbi:MULTISPECIES: MurR/RpiR family transcriptional regulator [Fusobacterium]|uniref:SIS domain-containing protein n=1 Tax=Fusobacterium mortiferum ATCC 9817 TaxID=469616 RepID=A0ABM6TU67_FUSMR|nr:MULTISPECIES: SIS domain-containing protein [Fusobacterium]AVQ18318.1 SIS domain-containing protein [Fusobacterium mortiferum ATCC 9817]EEO34552.1 SIS domain protein [Fusobacterium mortiferum ATCC 9817]MCF2626608.1 MurR/RpiR family transcriptional regulator [Fusobacterium mortiferum]MCF2699083.1 MurR/RpiR family transcriptional regulator [Fusobacterium mortiferum]MCI7666403.1 SIS domain-containing protein [Fusobacterium mortiferum]